MITQTGIYRHYGGGKYRVLFTMRDSTNGPHEGRTLVCYVSMTNGKIFARAEGEFHQQIFVDPDTGTAYSDDQYKALLHAYPKEGARAYRVVARFKFEGEA